MPRDLKDLGRTVELKPARRGRPLVAFVALALVGAAVAARAADEADPAISELVAPAAAPADEAPADATAAAPAAPQAPAPAEATIPMPVLGRAGGLLIHAPAQSPLLVSYHEASFIEALPFEPLGSLSHNENPTRPLAFEAHPDGIDFHVQVSRGRANASTSAVDVVLPPGEPVRAPVAGTVRGVKPYQLYGRHDDVRIELLADEADLAVVLIHVKDVRVRPGDRVEVGDVLAGEARGFPFGAVVDRLTEPERYGHVHMEVKAPE